MLKTFDVSLDIENQTSNNIFTISQNDLQVVEITFTLTQDKGIVNLTGLAPRIAIKKPSGLTVVQDCTVVDALKGKFNVVLSTQAYSEIGVHTGEIYIYSDTQVAVTGSFSYISKVGILNDTTLESSNDWQAINNALLNYMTNQEARDLIDAAISENGVNLQNYYNKGEIDTQLTSVTTQLAEIVTNVKSFGAVANANYYDDVTKKYYSDVAKTIPATDNKTAFQSAVDYLVSVGGGTLYVPKGNYVFRSGVKWHSNVSIKGEGFGNTALFAEGVLFDLFYNLDGASDGTDGGDENTWLKNCEFSGFSCDLKGLTHTQASVSGKVFFILYMKKARFRDLHLKNSIGTALGCDFLVDTVIENNIIENAGRNFAEGSINVGQSGIGIGTGALEYEPVIVKNNHIYNCGNYGVFVETQLTPTGIKSKGAQVVNNFLKGNKHGVGNKGSGGTLISGNTVIDSTDVGIYLSQKCKDDTIINNKVINSTREGIYVTFDYGGNLLIQGNEIAFNKRKGIEIEKATLTVSSVQITNNNIHDNNMAGINLFGKLKDVIISNNLIKNNCKTSVSPYNGGIMLEGIDANSIIDNLRITNNTILDDQTTKTQSFGIRVRPNITLNNFSIANNDFADYDYLSGIDVSGTAILNDSKIKNNNSYITEFNGTGTIADVASYVDITFPKSMAKIPTSVLLSPSGNTQIWYSNVTRLGMRVNRTGTTGALAFSWKAEI
jgi:hypothetical protein